jgi:hypothetical protein
VKHLVTPSQRKSAIRHLALHLYITSTPFQRVDAELFPLLVKAAVKLLAIHVTSGSAERNWSKWGQVFCARRNRLGIVKAAKLVSIMAWHGKQSAADSPDTLVSLDFVEESESEE